jgi:protein-tyrosine phosphatase
MSVATRPPRRADSGLKRLYLTAKNLPDRLLHRRRWASARRAILDLGQVRSILVVCYGNVCRSPYLEAVLRRDLPNVAVSSAGFVGPGRPVPAHSLAIARARGIDLSEFRSRPIARTAVASMDLVIVMDAKQAREVVRGFRVWPSRIVIAGDLDPHPSSTRAIRDPWGESIETFTSSFDRLDRCAATLTRLIRHRR